MTKCKALIRLAEETVKRKQTEDKLNNLQKKLDFNDQLHKEQMKDAAGKTFCSDVVFKAEIKFDF